MTYYITESPKLIYQRAVSVQYKYFEIKKQLFDLLTFFHSVKRTVAYQFYLCHEC